MADPQLAAIQAQLDVLHKSSLESQRLIKLSLMASGAGLPTTQIGATFNGSTIGTEGGYFELYRNEFHRLLACKVRCDFALPGNLISLSQANNLNGEVDVLGGSTRTVSDTLWVKPGSVLYVGNRNTVFTLTGSTLRVLLFDPLSYEGFLDGGV